MDQIKTGRLIRTMRTKLGLTQLTLAEKLGGSDKTVVSLREKHRSRLS